MHGGRAAYRCEAVIRLYALILNFNGEGGKGWVVGRRKGASRDEIPTRCRRDSTVGWGGEEKGETATSAYGGGEGDRGSEAAKDLQKRICMYRAADIHMKPSSANRPSGERLDTCCGRGYCEISWNGEGKNCHGRMRVGRVNRLLTQQPHFIFGIQQRV